MEVSRAGEMLRFQSQRSHRHRQSDKNCPKKSRKKAPKYPEQFLSVQRKVKVFVTTRFRLCLSGREGGRFGGRWEVWCSGNKSKLHWSEVHIVSDKDAAERTVRAPQINRELTEDRGRGAGERGWLSAPQFPRCCHRPARCRRCCCCCWRLSTAA